MSVFMFSTDILPRKNTVSVVLAKALIIEMTKQTVTFEPGAAEVDVYYGTTKSVK